jgi:hypothetical protein
MNTTRTKHDNLLAKIAEAIQAGQYVISNHAYQRARNVHGYWVARGNRN